jgi:hypothetical protein
MGRDRSTPLILAPIMGCNRSIEIVIGPWFLCYAAERLAGTGDKVEFIILACHA